MDDPSFDARKSVVMTELAKTNYSDKSPKGSIDERCLPLMRFLNEQRDYVTTSSCSGRIALWQDAQGTGECQDTEEDTAAEGLPSATKKKSMGGSWLYVSHDLPAPEAALSLTETDLSKGVIWFKFEPYILHVQARTLLSAKELLKAGLAAGFRNSGIVIGGSTERPAYIVAFRHTAKLDCPVAGEAMGGLNQTTLNWLFAEGATKLETTWERAGLLLEQFKIAVEKQEELCQKEDPKEKWKRRHEAGLAKQREAEAKRNVGIENAEGDGEEEEDAMFAMDF